MKNIDMKDNGVDSLKKVGSQKELTEKEKMLNNEMYNPIDEELSFERSVAKSKVRKINSMDRDSEEYVDTMRSLIGSMGENSWIEAPFFCDYGYNISIGDNFYGNTNITMLDCARINIGDNVFIGPNTSLYTPIHPMDYKTRNTYLEYAKDINIGDNVWIGGSVTIVAGVSIGSGSVIGAGSVVVKDIPDDVFAAGNPCRVIREIK